MDSITTRVSKGRMTGTVLIITLVILHVAGCSTNPDSNVRLITHDSYTSQMGDQAGGQRTSTYNPDNPRQARVDHLMDLMFILHYSTFAYYREFNKLPESLSDLENSNWLWLSPVPSEHIPDLILDGITISTNQENMDQVEFVLGPNGYTFAFSAPVNKDESAQSWEVLRWEEKALISDFNDLMAEFQVFSPYTDSNETNIRLQLLEKICIILTTRHWIKAKTLPIDTESLLDGKFLATSEIGNLSLIQQGEPGSFYFGVSRDKGISYIEYYFADSAHVVNQRVYLESDPMVESPGAVGRNACSAETVERDETRTVLSSELPGWGLSF